MQIDLKLLKTIRAVAQTGSMQGAAGRLFVTQSALSHQLKEIEQQLGQPLFVRKSQPVQFSWQGQLLLQLADEVLPKIDAVQQQLKQQPELPAQLRLTVECHACFHWLLPAVKAFRQQWPEVALSLDTEIEHHAIEAMLAGELDLVLTTDERLTQQVCYQPLFELELLAYLAPEHPLAAKNWLAPEDLREARLLSYPIPPERQDLFRYFLKKQDFSGERKSVAQASQMLQLVAAGEGIAVLPVWLAEPFLSQGLIVTRPLGAKGLKRTMYLASRRGDNHSAMQALYTLLKCHAPV
ncbi:MAG: LysR substrate-binding domain-containing protein [Rheinheimera sp.]|nr:LysR substrate-binding domain-containing protein [Rheinheimera sp.]